MASTWEQEKAYCTKRAAQATAEMEAAIQNHDWERFQRAWEAAMRYMNVKERKPYYLRMLAAGTEERRHRYETR